MAASWRARLHALAIAAAVMGLSPFAQAQEVRHFQDPGALKLAAYSTAVSARGLVFVSGVVPLDAETGKMVERDFEGQMGRAITNLKRALATAGATLADVIKVTVYIKNPADFVAMNRIYANHFHAPLPARTTVPGIDWGNGFLVEIDAVALDRQAAPDVPAKR